MSIIIEQGKQAKKASQSLQTLTTNQKNELLHEMANVLEKHTDSILAANEQDLENGKEKGFTDALLDRLRLSEQRILDMASGIRQVAALEDPIGKKVTGWSQPNGLNIEQIRVPLGVVGMIYEARPNVTVDASALCLKTGNAVLLRGSSSAFHSNQEIVNILTKALQNLELPEQAIQLVEDPSREAAQEMFTLNEYLDVLIPRGGANLIQTVVKQSSVPVLETGVGNCHVYIDDEANLDMAVSIAVNAKTQRPSVCNACESIVVHEKWADKHLKTLVNALRAYDVTIKADDRARLYDVDVVEASEEDWGTEYLDLTVSLKIVSSLDEAIKHIQTYGTFHSEAIVTDNEERAKQFLQEVDAAAVYHNASTRFTDGFEFGFGAEIGISTQKLHARGPMGLEALTSTKYVVTGNGQIK